MFGWHFSWLVREPPGDPDRYPPARGRGPSFHPALPGELFLHRRVVQLQDQPPRRGRRAPLHRRPATAPAAALWAIIPSPGATRSAAAGPGTPLWATAPRPT